MLEQELVPVAKEKYCEEGRNGTYTHFNSLKKFRVVGYLVSLCCFRRKRGARNATVGIYRRMMSVTAISAVVRR